MSSYKNLHMFSRLEFSPISLLVYFKVLYCPLPVDLTFQFLNYA